MPTTLSSNKLAIALFTLYLWVLPIAQTIALRNIFFVALIALTALEVWRKNIRIRFPLAAAWALYALAAISSLFYAKDFLFSLGEIKGEIANSLLVLMLAASWINNLKDLTLFLGLVTMGNALQIMGVIAKLLWFSPFWTTPDIPLSSLLNIGAGKIWYNGVGNLSSFLVTTLPLVMAFAFDQARQRNVLTWATLALVALNFLALYATGNRMGLIAAMVEIGVTAGWLIYHQKRRWLLITGALLVLLAIMGGALLKVAQTRTSENDAHWGHDVRWKMWQATLDYIGQHPVSGEGFGRTVAAHTNSALQKALNYEHAHNMVLNKGIQMGLPGIAAFLLLWAATIYSLRPGKEDDPRLQVYAVAATAMAAGVFAKNMTDDFFVQHNALLFWLLVGAILGARSKAPLTPMT
ncbi:MAG: O-antigen ligase family protein [Sulfuricellaceae bacterium]|jgi:O-antigen ligase